MCAAVSADKVCAKPVSGVKCVPGDNDEAKEDASLDISEKIKELLAGEKAKLERENPYKVPDRENFSTILQNEKLKGETKYKKMLKQPVHRKAPVRHTSPVNVLQTIQLLPEPKEPPLSPTSEIKDDPEFQQALAKGEKLRNMENLATFVNNKREMFLIQYMVGVKRDEMLRLVRREHQDELRLTNSEKTLEDDAVKFSDFLRSNDRDAVDAVKQAEMETKMKLDKATEIKKINIHIVNLKSKISKLEDILIEYKLYAKFLTSVAPQDWKEQKLKEKQQLAEQKAKALAELLREQSDRCSERALTVDKGKRVHISLSTASGLQLTSQSRKPIRKVKEKLSEATLKDDPEDHGHSNTSTILAEMISELQLSSDMAQYLTDDEEEEKAELYFADPRQLAGIFMELEEQNLGLIKKCQETEESLEEVAVTFNLMKNRMKKEMKFLKAQVTILERSLMWERGKADGFETMAKLYSFGEFNEDMQEIMLAELLIKIELVYTALLGPNDANLNAIQMLAAIEALLEDDFEIIEKMQPLKLEMALKARDRQRRALLREAKAQEQRAYLAQRKKKAMEKAVTVQKAVTRRKVLYRSQPSLMKRKMQKVKWRSRDEEEAQYFFT